ncbi:hypothetical protein [Gallaecimonas pentaromativorans]|uniref:hypothetical protein n=1 Tax=Gallaecimonas pentaromativorans TaxID=584787 RepID=UPI003A938BD5
MFSKDLENAVSSSLPIDIQPSTSAQRTLALRMAEALDLEVGYELLTSKTKISDFISQYQSELDAYEIDIEGHQIVSARLSEALEMYLSENDKWEGAFNIAFELYIQLPKRGRDLVEKSIHSSLSDIFWNEPNEKSEGEFCSLILKDLGFRHDRLNSFSSQFRKLHVEMIYT